MEALKATALPKPLLETKELELGEEAKQTVHRVLETFDTAKKGLELLHMDLFNSSPKVVLSALTALSRVRDPRSLKFISRLLTQPDEQIQCAAVKAMGDFGHPQAFKILFDLFKVSAGENLRCMILEALVKVSPQDSEALGLVREYSRTTLVSTATRAFAIGLLLRSGSPIDVAELLDTMKEEIVESVYAQAGTSKEVVAQVVKHGITYYHRLSANNRSRLVSIAAPFSLPNSIELLTRALGDVDPAVRRAAYQALGLIPQRTECLNEVIMSMAQSVDSVPVLEEEAISAIQRMEQNLAGGSESNQRVKEKVYEYIQELFKSVSRIERRVTSENHELGWLIARSKEYAEYYLDEELRHAFLQYLKGSENYSKAYLLQSLRSSAIKVEVRHFDGYRALVDLIDRPKRPGIALIARELAIVKLGKRRVFNQLIRNLWLSRLVSTPGTHVDTVRLLLQIYAWASQSKLFRLAEAALYALAKVDIQKATELCQECLKPPVVSKILAIAAIHLLKEMDWGQMEPVVRNLLAGTDDQYILLNLIDALSSTGFPISGEIVKSLVNIVRSSKNRQILQGAADFLGTQSAFNVFESVKEIFEQSEPWRRDLVLSILERKILEHQIANREGLIEFLYKILRQESGMGEGRAAVMLWRLGDDYALKVLREFVLNKGAEERISILRSLKGFVNAEIAPLLLPLLKIEHPGLQEALREVLLSAEETSTRDKICALVLSRQEEVIFDGERLGEANACEVQVDLSREKKAYRFEKEFVQELAILFTDIEGYSKKAQKLSTMQLSALIQEYESILLPVVGSHQGELIKRMGDGHLFIFSSPLHSVLAGIRLQKALKRFNSYREESERLIVRVGIHWGKVVRKEGDVLGNNVNIASRLESSARGASVLISDALHGLLGGHVLSREIGFIQVKGIADPIKVHEPYELALDFPEELDPLKSKKPEAPQVAEQQADHPANGAGQAKLWAMDGATLNYLVETFSCLNGLCRKVEAKEMEAAVIRRELAKRWIQLRGSVKKGGAQ